MLYDKLVLGDDITQTQIEKLQKMASIDNQSILDIQNASKQCIETWKKYSLLFFNCRHFVSRLNAALNGEDPNHLTKYWFKMVLVMGALGISCKVGEGIFSYLKNSTSDQMWYYRYILMNKSFRITFRVWRFGIFLFGLYGVGQTMHQIDNPKDTKLENNKSVANTAIFGVDCIFGQILEMVKKISYDLNKVNEAKYADTLPELSLSNGSFKNGKISLF